MKVDLQTSFSDSSLDVKATSSQRQLALALAALPEVSGKPAPLNLCLVLDHSGSMRGKPLETVKQAAQMLLEQLSPGDRISLVVFDHEAAVLVPNQVIDNRQEISNQIAQLQEKGGTAIDKGLQLGIEEAVKGKAGTVTHLLLLTDGENEHGDNNRCLKMARLATDHGLTVHTLGFGHNWNQDILEAMADAGGGSLTYIQDPSQANTAFNRIFQRVQAVGLTNAYLQLSLCPQARLAELKPIAQVSPDTIELPVIQEPEGPTVRIGDLSVDIPRVVLVNLYLGNLPLGTQVIGQARVRYDDPSLGSGLLSPSQPLTINVTATYTPTPNPSVDQHIFALRKYRQTQLAETRIREGDRAGAATMLQTAAHTALQMGDHQAATVLQESATRLQAGEDLDDESAKKTRIVSKTVLQ